MKKKYIFGIIILVVILIAFSYKNHGALILKMDDYTIYKDEADFLSRISLQYKSMIDVWPEIQEMEGYTIDECQNIILAKAEQIVLKNAGIVDDITYETFQKNLEEENAYRKNADAKGEIVYGPVEYAPEIYYDYIFSGYRSEYLENILGTSISEEEILEFYETNRESNYYKGRVCTANVIAIEKSSVQESIQELNNFCVKYEEKDFQDLFSDISKLVGEENVQYCIREFDDESYLEDIKYDYLLLNELEQCQMGQRTKVIETENTYYIAEVETVGDQIYFSLEEARTDMVRVLTQEKYVEKLKEVILTGF